MGRGSDIGFIVRADFSFHSNLWRHSGICSGIRSLFFFFPLRSTQRGLVSISAQSSVLSFRSESWVGL
jgi:hypothetical protein